MVAVRLGSEDWTGVLCLLYTHLTDWAQPFPSLRINDILSFPYQCINAEQKFFSPNSRKILYPRSQLPSSLQKRLNQHKVWISASHQSTISVVCSGCWRTQAWGSPSTLTTQGHLAICLLFLIHHKPACLIPISLKTTHASSAFFPWHRSCLPSDAPAVSSRGSSLALSASEHSCLLLASKNDVSLCSNFWNHWGSESVNQSDSSEHANSDIKLCLLMVRSCQVDAHLIQLFFGKGFQHHTLFKEIFKSLSTYYVVLDCPLYSPWPRELFFFILWQFDTCLQWIWVIFQSLLPSLWKRNILQGTLHFHFYRS